MRIRWIVAAIVALEVLGGNLVTAFAAPCPHNGQITFGRFDPELGDFRIWVADPDGTHQRALTTVPSFFSDWSPGGRRIAYDFADDVGVHIATVDATGRNQRLLTSGAGVQEVPRWSPDGQRIAFDASAGSPDDPDFSTAIWVMGSDGTHPRRVSTGGFDVEPAFSPDGGRLVFGRITGATSIGQQLEALYVVDIDGRHQHRIVAPTIGLEHPDWSPDGHHVVFDIAPEYPDATHSGAILTVRPDGQGMRVLAEPSDRLRYFKPRWSPDGRQLLAGCNDPQTGRDQLCVLDADGRRPLTIVGGDPDPVNFPAWGTHPSATSPSGRESS